MFKLPFARSTTSLMLTTVAAAAALLVPTSALALQVGAEANGELINSDRTPALQAAALDKLQAQGVQVVRINMGWNEIAAGCGTQANAQLTDPENACYTWGVLDSLVMLATERNIKVLMSTSRAPEWVQPGKPRNLPAGERPYWLGSTPAEFNRTVAAYTAFIQAAGTRYGAGSMHGTIPYWTIWNEPNSVTFFKPAPNAQRYALMYAKAAVALKQVFPTAQVAPGPTGPNSTIKPVPYIKAFQASVVKFLPKAGAKRYVNAWAHNPYPNQMAPTGIASGKGKGMSFGRQESLGMADTPRLIKLLDSSSITRGVPVWGTEFGYETPPDTINKPVSTLLQAQYLAESFDFLTSLKRVAIGVQYGLTDNTLNADWQSGTFTATGVAKPAFYMYQRMISSPAGSVRRGTKVRVWGRSNIAPAKGQLVYRTTSPLSTVPCTMAAKAYCWKAVPGARKAADGSWSTSFRVTSRETYFAIYDGVQTIATGGSGYGYYRRVLAN